MPGTVSPQTCRALFDDAQSAGRDHGHVCHYFTKLQLDQNKVPIERWQLPVPFMGRQAAAGVVFLGCNPSYDYEGNEDDPRIGCEFPEYDTFWRRYFEDRPRSTWPRLYRLYQQIGERAVPGFRLGEDGLVLESIHYRCANSYDCWRRGVWKHERCITLDALKDVAPRAIFCCGKDALWCVRDLLSDLARQLPDPFRIAEVEGRLFREVESPWGSVAVVGCRHLTGVWRGDEKKVALGDALRDALGDI